MIKANELRLGSLFEYESCIYSANVIKDNFVYGKNINGFSPGEFPIDKINPVDITEKFLIKAGFERVFTNDYWYQIKIGDKRLLVSILGNVEIEKWDRTMINFLSICEYVHQLQNLYFSLTGEELAFSTTEP